MPVAKGRLLGRAFSSLHLEDATAQSGTLVAVLTNDDFAAAGARPEHTDGIIDDLKRIEGADVILMLREQTPSEWRVSMRSTDLDVASIAVALGGGGHRLAAGCEMTGPRDGVTSALLARIRSARQDEAAT
jgi:phosphoesterase RecJ-like protein